MSTSGISPKPENLMKIKAQVTGIFPPEPENILKTNPLTMK
jgi:hypothetical protein